MLKKIHITFGIRIKIFIMLLGISIISVSIMGLTSYQSAKSVLNQKLKTTSEQTIGEVSRGIDNYFLAMSNLVKVVAQDADIIQADNKTSMSFAKHLIANVKDTDENIVDLFVGMEKGAFYTYPEQEAASENDYKSSEWYTQAVDHRGEVIITKPYISQTGKRVVTIAKTIDRQYDTMGVVGMNIDLEMFSNSLSDIVIGKSGYIFIADMAGNMISHPDRSLIGTQDAKDLSFWSEATAKEQGFTSYEYQGVSRFGAFYTSKVTGWKIIASMENSELKKDVSGILKTFLIVLIIICIAALLVSYFFSSSISANINKLVELLGKVSQGDFTVSSKVKSRDEFRQLGEHFNLMVSNVSGLIQNLQKSTSTVNETAVMMANIAKDTNYSIKEVAGALDEVSQGAAQQAESASEGSDNILQLSDLLGRIDQSTQIIYELSGTSSDLTENGLKQIDILLDTSGETKVSTEKISELVKDMNESMNRINEISDTITGITNQTNLLSLNASIEAARAGESGRGFSVVAGEIRKMSEQSRVSAVQIKEILEELKEKAASSAEAMELTNRKVALQEEAVDQTKAVFYDIMAAVKALAEKIQEINGHISKILTKKEIIVEQIENISAVSQESASALEEVNASTEVITDSMGTVSVYANELQQLAMLLETQAKSFTVRCDERSTQ